MGKCTGPGWDGLNFLHSNLCGADFYICDHSCDRWPKLTKKDILCHIMLCSATKPRGRTFSKVGVAQRPAGHLSAWWEVASICPCIISWFFLCPWFIQVSFLNLQVYLAFALLILPRISLWEEWVSKWLDGASAAIWGQVITGDKTWAVKETNL